MTNETFEYGDTVEFTEKLGAAMVIEARFEGWHIREIRVKVGGGKAVRRYEKRAIVKAAWICGNGEWFVETRLVKPNELRRGWSGKADNAVTND